MLIDLIRHGEPVGGRRYRGQLDDPLSEKGWRQMRRAVGDHAPWDRVVTSPLRRCAEFAAELARHHGLPCEEEPQLREVGFGVWEGRTAAELTQEDPEILMRFYRDPVAHRPPGAEPLEEFRQRVVGCWEELLTRRPGSHLLLVAHAGVIRVVLCHVLGMPLERMYIIQVPNAGITRIRVDGEGKHRFARLLFHGGTLESSECTEGAAP